MGIFEILILAVGLSMDAFAVAICKGLATSKIKPRHAIITGIWFGGFQALMPLIGYFFGTAFEKYLNNFDHWIAFFFLVTIGINMIRESFGAEENTDCSYGVKNMFVMAIATSIDALAVGVTFALLPNVNIIGAVTTIGVITFALSALGVKIGNIFGAKYKQKAEICGGSILIIIGFKILLEHLDIIQF